MISLLCLFIYLFIYSLLHLNLIFIYLLLFSFLYFSSARGMPVDLNPGTDHQQITANSFQIRLSGVSVCVDNVLPIQVSFQVLGVSRYEHNHRV